MLNPCAYSTEVRSQKSVPMVRESLLATTVAGIRYRYRSNVPKSVSTVHRPSRYHTHMIRSDRPIDVAVIGVGRMGRHHVRIYTDMSQVNLVAVVDADIERRHALADEFGCAAFENVAALLAGLGQKISAISVAVPTKYHAEIASACLRRGIACLVEKPLASNSDEARQLMTLAGQHQTVLQVGHTERFNPAVQAVAAMDITPRFMEVHRVSPMTFRSLDVGVVMDMMIHDLDIVLKFANAPLVQVDATGVAVLGEQEDVANARLMFASGCVANLTASRLALKTERKLRVFSEEAYVSLDYQNRSGVVIRKSGNLEALDDVRAQIARGTDLSDLDYSKLVQVEQLVMGSDNVLDDPLTAELTSFIDTVRSGGTPEVDAEAGYAAVDAAQQVVESLRTHQWDGLAEPRV